MQKRVLGTGGEMKMTLAEFPGHGLLHPLHLLEEIVELVLVLLHLALLQLVPPGFDPRHPLFPGGGVKKMRIKIMMIMMVVIIDHCDNCVRDHCVMDHYVVDHYIGHNYIGEHKIGAHGGGD